MNHPTIMPSQVTTPRDLLVAAYKAISSGREYAQMNLTEHDMTLGRATIKNRVWAENMERDIAGMDCVLAQLKTILST